MNGLPYYKAYPRDFIEGTIGMPLDIKGPYRILLDLIYMQGGKLPDDARYISGLLGCSIRRWKSIRLDLIERRKVFVSGEFLTNKRADKELETLAKLQEVQRENATGPRKNKGLQKPRQNQPEPEPEPDIKREAKASPKRPARKTRMPEDACISQRQIEIAEEEGHSAEEAEAQFAKFKDYALANGKTYANWDSAWRNWFRSNFFKPMTGGGYGNGNRRADADNPTLRLIADAARAR